ncbi:universal stress protein [Streptomyces sp. NBC_00448]|uniref:universal stress protein n=1 Tax=Streptomyces sp. NBC_00448 TaxID=2903652 RepID=UPI002E1DD953
MTEPDAERSEATSAPTSESATEYGRIVVGVDGSDPSLHALRWADRQATLTGASLEAVTAWEMPASFGWGGAVPGLPEGYDLGESAAQALREALEKALPPDRAATVSPVTVMGNPAQVILDRGEGAELIVVGVRGHGTFRSTLLGSVSHTVTLHASCPVVVVRGEAQQAD